MITPVRVTVFGASGRMGQAQLRELHRAGFRARAVTRRPQWFEALDLPTIEVCGGDYGDAGSLDRALEGADAVFYSPPPISTRDRVLAQVESVIAAAWRAGSPQLILNSKMWAPDAPCGEPTYDLVLEIEELFATSDLPVVTFRPVLFMDNLLTRLAKPALVIEGVYRYCQLPDMTASWMAMDDLARFMVAALGRIDLAGERIRLGGPETLSIAEVVEILGQTLGNPLRYEYVTPREFGLLSHAALGLDDAKVSATGYADFFDSFYTFNNESPLQPFLVNDMEAVLQRIPITCTTFAEWCAEQDWSYTPEADLKVGSRTG